MAESRCMQRVLTGAALGGAVGGAVGACYGTYEAFAYKVRVFVNSRFDVLSPFSLCSQTLTHYMYSIVSSLFVFFADIHRYREC